MIYIKGMHRLETLILLIQIPSSDLIIIESLPCILTMFSILQIHRLLNREEGGQFLNS